MRSGIGWTERFVPDHETESAFFKKFAEFVGQQIMNNEGESGERFRFLHSKPHLAVTDARLEINREVPDEFRLGLFQPGKVYENVTVRFSSAKGLAAGNSKSDIGLDLRGLAIRVPFENSEFDFLGTNAAQHHFRDARQFFAWASGFAEAGIDEDDAVSDSAGDLLSSSFLSDLVNSATEKLDALLGQINQSRAGEPSSLSVLGPFKHVVTNLKQIFVEDGVDEETALINSINELRRILTVLGPQLLNSIAQPSLATQSYYSRGPFQLGELAVKYRLIGEPSGLFPPFGRNALASELRNRLAEKDIVMHLELQIFKDAESTPVEDTSVEWTEEISPFQRIAMLTIGQRDVSDHAEETRDAEQISFSPWQHVNNGNPETTFMYPIGHMNRARNAVYQASAAAREKSP